MPLQPTLSRFNRATRKLDELIADRINARIGGRIRNLSVEIRGKTVRLLGECSTFYTKQLAQHAALGVLEDEKVINDISVRLPG